MRVVTVLMIAASTGLAGLGCAHQHEGLPETFHTGPVFTDFGPVASVSPDVPLAADSTFRVAFDVSDAAEPGTVNRGLVSAARFINMHAEAGIATKNLQLAIVVHGGATLDLLIDSAYAARHLGARNANVAVLASLMDVGVEVQVCGQSAAAKQIDKEALVPGVEVALSAMTAHAMLQQGGYTLNPF
jgi:intracellular sulfur oxidation DsrE/DsrF family protein